MSGWIKLDKDMTADPRLVSAAARLSKRYIIAARSPAGGSDLSASDELRFARNALLGALVTLWEYADTHIRDDDTLPISADALDALVGIDGFFGLMPREWMAEVDEFSIRLPGYCVKNELISKRKRAEDSKRRQAVYREKQKKSNAYPVEDVTHHVTHNEPVTKCVDQDLYQDQDLKKKKRVSTTPVEPKALDDDPPDPVVKVFDHWREIHRHPHAKLDLKRRRIIAGALKHYSEADLCQAIAGYRHSPHHMGQNERATVYDDIELMLRDSKHIDAGLRFYAEPPRTDLSPQTRRIVAATEDWTPPETRHAASG